MGSIELARAQTAPNLSYVVGEVLTHPFEAESFDLVTSVASLHHMDAIAGLQRMADLLRPGGVLAVIGCARSRLPVDLPWEADNPVVDHRLSARHRRRLAVEPGTQTMINGVRTT